MAERISRSLRRVALLGASLICLLFFWSQRLADGTLTTSSILASPSQLYEDVDLSSARAPFIAWPLQRVCAEATFVPGLAFICDNNSGGPGNIRNYILTCIRYAVEAGATSLVLPRIRSRAEDDPANLFKAYRPFGYMFDEAHFRGAMKAACPQIAIHAKLEDVPGARLKARREALPVDKMVHKITPKNFGSRAACDERDQNRHTDRFGQSFRKWMKEKVVERGQPATDPDNPMLVRFSWGVLWDWPIYRDGPEFVATFGGLLKIREDILGLADAIELSIRGDAVSTSHSEVASNQSFLGIHLRTEEDALERWPSYASQSTGYLQQAEKQGFRGDVAYLASGSEAEAHKFGEQAMSSLQLRVRSKYDLLDGPRLEQLKAMSWDQQALVDFVVLLKSDYFVGVSPSSFSINVALKRHLKKEGQHNRPWRVGDRDDGRSWLVGRYDRYFEEWLFIFDGMWP